MTREEAKKLLPIIQAYGEGKTIQRYKPDSDEWEDLTTAGNDYVDFEDIAGYEVCYRVKPEPKYRPFKNAEECWNEMKKHQPFGWLKDKYSFYSIEMMGASSSKEYIKCYGIWITSEQIFKDATFLDGTPFGVKIEEDKQ